MCSIFNDTVSVSEYVVPDGRVIGGKGLEGSGFGVIEVNFRDCLEGQREVRIADVPCEILSVATTLVCLVVKNKSDRARRLMLCDPANMCLTSHTGMLHYKTDG
jgi:hypothetical protein